MNATTSRSTATLLEAVYKNVKMASEALLGLMPKVRNDQLKNDMTVQLSVYEAFASRAAKLLGEEGVKPVEENVVTRLSSKMGIKVQTMMDSSSSHIAAMIIEGTTMGVNDMIKEIREKENTCASESSLRLARDVCAFEEKTIEEMKAYL